MPNDDAASALAIDDRGRADAEDHLGARHSEVLRQGPFARSRMRTSVG